MVAIILYADDVVILSKLGACLQRLLNKLMSFAIFLALKSISLRLNSWYLAAKKLNLNQEAFYLDNNPIAITHECNYFGIDSYSHGYFEPSSEIEESQVCKPWWALEGNKY